MFPSWVMLLQHLIHAQTLRVKESHCAQLWVYAISPTTRQALTNWSEFRKRPLRFLGG